MLRHPPLQYIIRSRVLAYLNSISLLSHSSDFEIPFNQQLEDYLNAERTTLLKELGKMYNKGVIAYRRNHFPL